MKATMPLPADVPRVALDFMNRDHEAFAKSCRDLMAMIPAGVTVAAITNALEHLIDHTRQHFAEEERWMLRHGFPPYPVHRAEHERVLTDMDVRLSAWRQQGDAPALLVWLETAVTPWFLEHLGSMDFVTAQFIAARQRTDA